MFKKKKKEEDRDYRLRASLASRPASVNIEFLIADAKETICAYLSALYRLSQGDLPMEQMEEGAFYGASDSILQQWESGIRRILNHLDVTRIQAFDYDNHMFFAVSEITYDVDYEAEGVQVYHETSYPFHFFQSARFLFRYDSRMGWLLAEIIDDGSSR